VRGWWGGRGWYDFKKLAFDAQVDTWQDSLVEAAQDYDRGAPWAEAEHEANETDAVGRVGQADHCIPKLFFLVIGEVDGAGLEQEELG
jgi:hypothetical protein